MVQLIRNQYPSLLLGYSRCFERKEKQRKLEETNVVRKAKREDMEGRIEADKIRRLRKGEELETERKVMEVESEWIDFILRGWHSKNNW